MKTLMSLPLCHSVLADYPPENDLAAACGACGCDGLEVVWGGEPLPTTIPTALHVGYHLTFFPDWLDFWRNDRAALNRKFGGEEQWQDFYGGENGRETLLAAYRADLARAEAWGAQYVVFHVSDVSLEEGYTYRWAHTCEEVIDAAAEVANLLLQGRDGRLLFLVENQWWPGFTFDHPAQTRRLLDAIAYENKGIMLDTGHLMNTDRALADEAGGIAHLHRMLDAHGDLCGRIRGVHLHQSISGPYLRARGFALPEPFDGPYLTRFAQSYAHVLKLDAHNPFTRPEIAAVIRRIEPDFLVHELSAQDRSARERRLRVQREALRRGGLSNL